MPNFFSLVGEAADLADLVEQPLFVHLFLFEVLAVFVALFFDNLTHADFVLRQFLAEIQDVGQGQRTRQNFVDDAIFAFFDLLRDFDFALAAEQRYGAHLAQIHAYGISGLADNVAVHVPIGFFLFLFFLGNLLARAAERHSLIGVDDFDVHFAKDRHDIVDLVRRDHFGRQHVVHVVVSQVALLLAQVDELFDLFHDFFSPPAARRNLRRRKL